MDNSSKILGGLLAVAILIIILMRGCGEPRQNIGGEIVVKVDTVRYETVYDTNWYDTTKFKYITVNVVKPYYDTTIVYKSVYTANDFDQIMSHPSIYEDSTIKDDTVTIYYKATVRGFLDDLKLGYKIYKPSLISKTTILETEITKAKKFNGFYLGLNAGTRLDSVGLFSFTPMLEASFRNINVELGYDIVDGSIEFGIKRRISFRKKKNP